MSESSPSEGSSKEKPYGKTPIVLLLFHIVWTFYGNLRAIPDTVGLYADIEELASKGAALSPELSSELPLWRSLALIEVISIAAWFVIIALLYAFGYGLWKPKRWARKVGVTSLGLGLIVSLARFLATVAIYTVLQLDIAGLVRPGIFNIVWDVVAFSAGLWFLSKPEVRDYIKVEGYGYAEPTPPAVEEEIEREPVPLQEAEVEPAAPVGRSMSETWISILMVFGGVIMILIGVDLYQRSPEKMGLKLVFAGLVLLIAGAIFLLRRTRRRKKGRTEPIAPIERVQPEETLPRIARIPDSIRGKRPESVAWIAEDRCMEEIFLDGDHLIIVKLPDEPVIDIPIKDIVKLERGEMSRYAPGALDVLRGMGISIYDTTKISELNITYSTKPGLTSTVTLVAERKICPECGGRMSLVAAGWYCKRDDHLIDPATNDLVKVIESRRSKKTSKRDVTDR